MGELNLMTLCRAARLGVAAGAWLAAGETERLLCGGQRCEEAGENPARSRHCDRAVPPGSQIFCRCPVRHCQGRVIPKELL